jgi:hypothetical protein
VVEQKRREAVRRAYGRRCGYCGVHEEEAGSKLEVDHFRPRSAGGANELENLVYCCPTCNRLKGDFWADCDPLQTPHRLLHPKRDNVTQHLQEGKDGRLTALTETGRFHIEQLRLNRPPLVALRRARRETEELRRDLTAAQDERARLRERIDAIERELTSVLDQLLRLSGQ